MDNEYKLNSFLNYAMNETNEYKYFVTYVLAEIIKKICYKTYSSLANY